MEAVPPQRIPRFEPLHLIAASELAGRQVSSFSQWDSPVWQLDNPTHGAHRSSSRVIWKIQLEDGSLLTDAHHYHLLDWLRRVVWSLIAEPGDGRPPLSAGSAGTISAGLSRVVPWLVRNSINSPHELTCEVLDQFLLDLPQLLGSSSCENHYDSTKDIEDPDITLGAATSSIKIFYYIWRQREALLQAGIPPMPSQPWQEEKGAIRLAIQVSKKVVGWISPLPDEIAVPLLNSAIRFVEGPAEDILRLRDYCEDAYNSAPADNPLEAAVTPYQRFDSQREAAYRFRFTVLPDESTPWHAPIEEVLRSREGISAMQIVRQRVIDLQAACCILIQALTGMRVSELCGLKAGLDPTTSLPVNVKMRLSSTGLNEEFILVGELSKGHAFPIEVPWLLGSRRCGDNELPIAVRAIILLEKLLRPYRALIDTDKLLISIKCARGLPKNPGSVSDMISARISEMYKSYISTWVDLSVIPDESIYAAFPKDLVEWRVSSGRIITTHQLRKTYAQYVLSTNSALLPAVQRQFHHVNVSITENGYWGKASTQIEPLQSISRQLTSKILLDVIEGKVSLGGKMGKLVHDNAAVLAESVKGLPRPSAWRKIGVWLEENDIQANHSRHGVCIPISSSRMECWKKSGSLPSGSLLPNFQTRDISLCAGCRCFAIHESHIPFWKERYIDLEASRRTLPISPHIRNQFREINRRAKLASKLLQSVGVDVPSLEPSILSRMQNT